MGLLIELGLVENHDVCGGDISPPYEYRCGNVGGVGKGYILSVVGEHNRNFSVALLNEQTYTADDLLALSQQPEYNHLRLDLIDEGLHLLDDAGIAGMSERCVDPYRIQPYAMDKPASMMRPQQYLLTFA